MTTGIAAQHVQLGASSTFNMAKTINVNQEHHATTTGSAGFDLLVQYVAKVARHDSGEMATVGACHPGTRVHILRELKEWTTAASYPSPIKWMYGTVAVGKSAILREICRYLSAQGLLMAAFFFPRLGDSRNEFSQWFIPTLAYELSISIPETRPYIERAVEKDPLIFFQSLSAQTQDLIISPLRHLYKADPSFAPHSRVIVVDGLDECTGEKQNEILQTLVLICRDIPFPLAILVASRPEPYILHRFNRQDLYDLSERVALDRSSKNADRDIRKYYEDHFDEIRTNYHPQQTLQNGWPPAGHIDMLVRRASGQFGFAATVIAFVGLLRRNPARQLDIILGQAGTAQQIEAFSPLDQLYTTILRDIEPKFRGGAMRALGVLLVLTDGLTTLPLTPTLIERLLRLDEGEARNLLFDVQSLVQVEPKSSQLIIAHDSLREFLSDKSRSNDLYIDPPTVYEDLARNSISLLMDDVGEDLQGFIVDNMLTFFHKADPTADLQSSIEKCIENLEKIYFSSTNCRLVLCPIFYEAVKSSKLEDANILSKRILHCYTLLLSKGIYLYTADDPPIACLILLSRFRGDQEEDECLYRMIMDIFDRFPDTRASDLDKGLCIRDTVLFLMKRHHMVLPNDPILRATDLSSTAISRLVNNMPDRDQFYSKTARYLLGYMFTDSLAHVAATEFPIAPNLEGCPFAFGFVLSQVLPGVLAASQPDPGLTQYIMSHTLSKDYQEFKVITDAIRDYLERATGPSSSSLVRAAPLETERVRETLRQRLEAGIHAMGRFGNANLGRAFTQQTLREPPGGYH